MLTIVLLTCVRNQLEDQVVPYAQRTLRTTLEHLLIGGDKVALHIADDTNDPGKSREHVDALCDIADKDFGIADITSSWSKGKGYGANYNLAMQAVHKANPDDFVMPLEDDWELLKDLDVSQVMRMMRDKSVGCVRMGYLGYTQWLRGTFFVAEGLHWIELDPMSAEPHVFAGHPRIETVGWERRVGPWQVGLAAGDTEWEVTHRKLARVSVVWPISLVKPEGDLFVHIGTVKAGE
jgi:hypothetical protein